MTEHSRRVSDVSHGHCMSTQTSNHFRTTDSDDSSTIPKPAFSHVALIATAILSCESKKMLLSEIFQWVTSHFPYFKMAAISWRNSIRHNLSVNECFVKCGRSEAGKGHYWTIHPVNVDDFIRGDFRRRRARQRVHRLNRRCDDIGMYRSGSENISTLLYANTSSEVGYVPMTVKMVTVSYLVEEFGMDVSSID